MKEITSVSDLLEKIKSIPLATPCRLFFRGQSNASWKPVSEIADGLGIPQDELEPYGKNIAKVPLTLIDEARVKKSKLILVTAITPTKAGIGKTTVSVGLAKIRKKAVAALREPSLGPCFGMKSRAAFWHSRGVSLRSG